MKPAASAAAAALAVPATSGGILITKPVPRLNTSPPGGGGRPGAPPETAPGVGPRAPTS